MHLWPDEVFNIETAPVFMNYSTVLSRSAANLTQSMAELFGVVPLLVAAESLATLSKVSLEKLTVTPPEIISAFHETRKCVTVFTRARYWSLSREKCTQSIPPYSISLESILILSFHLRVSPK
jgi:hypothetical protein